MAARAGEDDDGEGSEADGGPMPGVGRRNKSLPRGPASAEALRKALLQQPTMAPAEAYRQDAAAVAPPPPQQQQRSPRQPQPQPKQKQQRRQPHDWMHQVEPLGETPDPYDGAMRRWPDTGWTVGGPPAPNDGRRHLYWFGYREGREKSTWIPGKERSDKNALSLNLDDIKVALTARYGTLGMAFKCLDFFQDRNVTAVEWQEGVYNVLTSFKGEEGDRYRSLCNPREVFNKRMQEIFRSMDIEGHGRISLQDLVAPRAGQGQAIETPHELTRRLTCQSNEIARRLSRQVADVRLPRGALDLDRERVRDEVEVLSAAAKAGVSEAGRPSRGSRLEVASQLLRSFATLLAQKYANVDDAFAAIDTKRAGTISLAEFLDAAKVKVRFAGDAGAVFRELDKDQDGLVSLPEFRLLRDLPTVPDEALANLRMTTRRDMVATRRQRSNIEAPRPLERGLSLTATDYRPLGERVSSSAGFYSFSRLATGRLDPLLHPEELPGFDPHSFTPERGPGYCKRGPEFFSEVGCDTHPKRGNGWKMGATMNREERFGPAIRSAQGRKDRELSAACYLSHEGIWPQDGYRINGKGATGLASMHYRGGVKTKTPGMPSAEGDRGFLRRRSRSEPGVAQQAR